jgi:hypothetical protein
MAEWEQPLRPPAPEPNDVLEQALLGPFKVTSNVSRRTFNHIKENPYCTTEDVCSALAKQGLKRTSVSSLIGQMCKQGIVAKDQRTGWLQAVATDYTPLKKRLMLPQQTPRKVKVQQKNMTPTLGIATITPQTNLLDTLTIRQARNLFNELKTIFGEL